MAMNYSISNVFALVFKLFFVIVAVGPTCDAQNVTTVKQVTATSISQSFSFPTSPLWIENALYFPDEDLKVLIKYDPSANKTTFVDVGTSFKFLLPAAKDGKTFLAGDGGVAIQWFTWDGSSDKIANQGSLKVLDDPSETADCGRSDAKGRLYVCSNARVIGKVYMVDRNTGSVTIAIDKMDKMPKEIAFSPDNTRLYVAVYGLTFQIVCYKYGIDTGAVDGTCQEFFDFGAGNVKCIVSNMVIDTAGSLWVSCYAASYVLQVDVVLHKLIMQVNIDEGVNTIGVAFGGASMGDLYITSKVNAEKVTSGSIFLLANTNFTGAKVQEV